MKFEIDTVRGNLKIVPTTEEDRRQLRTLNDSLSQTFGHSHYVLRYFGSGRGSADSPVDSDYMEYSIDRNS